MNIEELKQRALLLKGPNKRLRHLKYTDIELVEYLNNNYPSDITFAEKLYWFTHDIIVYPTCHNCGKRLKFKDGCDGYGVFCSAKCANTNQEKKDKTCKSKLQKYGDVNYNNRIKAKETCLKVYGYDNPRKNKDIQKKAVQTNIERYGDPYYSNSEKRKKTCMERYGDPYYTNWKQSIQTKIERYGDPYYSNIEQTRKTKIERYGDPYYSNSEKRKKTCMERYGAETLLKLPEIREKIIKTNLKKYGCDNPPKNKEISKKLSDSIKKSNIKRFDFLLGYSENGNWICKCPHPECNKCIEKRFEMDCCLYRNRENEHVELCPILNPINSYSSRYSGLECFINGILNEHNIEYIHNDKKILNGLELDFYIPSQKTAIECNGCFWHCSTEKPKKYHIDKFLKCQKMGIKLISVWEDQMLNNSEIIKSIILSSLGIYKYNIDANKCVICNINSSAEFLKTNYIYGVSNSSINLGLKFNNELVCLMGFSKIGNKQNQWRINYCCSKLNTKIEGFEKIIIDEFVKNYSPSQLIYVSYNDIGNDNFCVDNKFEKDLKVIGNHWFIQHWRYDRLKKSAFSIKKLKSLNVYNEEKTFDEIMNNLYFRIIYDSGKTKWIKKYE